jgi:hypothetical protein
MNKYKEGDKVRISHNSGSGALHGKTGMVMKVHERSSPNYPTFYEYLISMDDEDANLLFTEGALEPVNGVETRIQDLTNMYRAAARNLRAVASLAGTDNFALAHDSETKANVYETVADDLEDLLKGTN